MILFEMYLFTEIFGVYGPIKGQTLAHSYGLFQIHAIRVKSILTRNQIDTFTERNLFGTCASTVFKPLSPVPGEYFRLRLECRKTLFCNDAWLFDWVVLVYSDETRWFCFNKEKIWLSTDRKFPVVRKYLRIRNFPVVRKKIYGSVSEAGELGHSAMDHMLLMCSWCSLFDSLKSIRT